jgi:hypothetical protein
VRENQFTARTERAHQDLLAELDGFARARRGRGLEAARQQLPLKMTIRQSALAFTPDGPAGAS